MGRSMLTRGLRRRERQTRRRLEVCRSRRSGAPAVERRAQTGAPRSGDLDGVLRKVGGDGVRPELAGNGGRSSGSASSIQGSLVAFRAWSLRGREEETQAVKWAWSRGGLMRPFTRIDRRRYLLQRPGVVCARKKMSWRGGVGWSARERRGELGPLVSVSVGQ